MDYQGMAVSARFTIIDIPSMMHYKNAAPTHTEVVEKYLYDVWRRLMNKENFETSFKKALELNFREFFHKYVELKTELPHAMEGPIVFAIMRDNKMTIWNIVKSAIEVDKRIIALIAARFDREDVLVDMLLAGVDVRTTIADVSDRTPPDYNVSSDEALKYWTDERHPLTDQDESKLMIEIFGYEGVNMLHYAARNGNRDFAEALIERGIDVDYCSGYAEESTHAIEHAAEAGHMDMARFLYPYARTFCSKPSSYSYLHNSDWMFHYFWKLTQRLDMYDQYEKEANEMDFDDCHMFAQAAFRHPVQTFFAIVRFGNIAYYSMAALLLEQKHEEILAVDVNSDYEGFARRLKEIAKGEPSMRPGCQRIFERYNELLKLKSA